MNILGIINLDNMYIFAKEYTKNVNSISVLNFCNKIQDSYFDKQIIHIILDQVGSINLLKLEAMRFS